LKRINDLWNERDAILALNYGLKRESPAHKFFEDFIINSEVAKALKDGLQELQECKEEWTQT
jgi:hypothetical protein